ncbi:MAG: hypothetical protein QOE63_64 [Acidimicrobiaceae bacterium]
MSSWVITAPPRVTIRRLPRLIVGLVMCGVGIALMVASDLGLAPWDVLHQGIAKRTGIAIGTVGILVGVVILLAWRPLGERYGVGTLTNVVLIGVTIDVVLPLLPEHPSAPTQWAFLVVGAFLFGPGGALYIGVGLGAGPRDGIMTSLAARGFTLWKVRAAMELAVLAVGWLLGGSVGIGTVVFALTIGPNVHFFLERWTMEPISEVHPLPVHEVE